MPPVMHDKWWLWGHRIIVQKHISHLGLWRKRENTSFTITISCNATQPGNLQDTNGLPCGLHKYLGAVTLCAVVSLLTQTGTAMSTTEIPLTATKTCTGSLQWCKDKVKAHFPRQQFSAFFLPCWVTEKLLGEAQVLLATALAQIVQKHVHAAFP